MSLLAFPRLTSNTMRMWLDDLDRAIACRGSKRERDANESRISFASKFECSNRRNTNPPFTATLLLEPKVSLVPLGTPADRRLQRPAALCLRNT